MYPKLVVFDIDGTLLPDTTIARHMAVFLDDLALIDQMEAAWETHNIDHQEFAIRSAEAYAGHRLDSLVEVAHSLPVINGAFDVIRTLRDNGTVVILATVSMAFAARVLVERLGCNHAGGTELELLDGVFTGRIAKFNDEAAKAEFVRSFATERRIALQDVTAVGDSRSDIPLFGQVGRSIALNASPAAITAATHSISTRNLLDILPLLEV